MTKEMAKGMLKHYGFSGLTEGLEELEGHCHHYGC